MASDGSAGRVGMASTSFLLLNDLPLRNVGIDLSSLDVPFEDVFVSEL